LNNALRIGLLAKLILHHIGMLLLLSRFG